MTYQEGDPGHLSVHNALRAELDEAATQMGVEVVLPDEAVAGNTGHVDAHNLITDALDKIAAEGSAGASWAQVISAPDAVTSSYYDDKGGQWQYWEWNAPGTFDVEVSGGVLWCLVVGAGSRGWQSVGDGHVAQGQPGQVREGLWEFGPGTHSVTVGDIGTGEADASIGGGSWVGDYKVFSTHWGSCNAGRGSDLNETPTPYYSSITGDSLGYAPGSSWRNANEGNELRPGQGGECKTPNLPEPGTVIIATRIDVPTLPPAPPRLEVAPVVAAPVSISGPAVQEWLVRDKQGARKVVYFLPGNTGTARALGLTEEGAEALAARRELLDAIATTDVPDDFEGDPVTLLPKKLRAELRGFVEVRATPQPEAVYSVTLGAGVLPGVMVGAGGCGGGIVGSNPPRGGGGGAGGVIGQGAHVPVILPVQGTATYTVTVASTSTSANLPYEPQAGGSTSIAVQGQTPFTAAVGGGGGCGAADGHAVNPSVGGSGGGSWSQVASGHFAYVNGALGVPGQGNQGGPQGGGPYGDSGAGGGGYGSRPTNANGGDGFDLATALNLDPNDGLTGSFLGQVSVDGFIAGGGAANGGTPSAGGGAMNGNAKDYTGGGGGGHTTSGTGGAGAVYIITDPS